jgi:DNA polymerase III subunit delta'
VRGEAMFREIVGHERVRDVLGRSVASGRLPPALLLTGPDGIGKKTLALAVARGLLCERGPGEPCAECSPCRRIARSVEAVPEWRAAATDHTDEPARLNHRLHPDVVLVEAWRTATRAEIKVAQVRDLIGEVAGVPFEARARVFIVDDAHTMNEQAANALLKSLEEPPATSHLILVTPAPQALLSTIRSRCQILRLATLPSAAVETYLRDHEGLAEDEVRLRSAVAGGSLGSALSLESDTYRGLRDEMLGLLERSGPGAAAERIGAAERLADGDDPVLALTVLRSLLRDALALRAGARGEVLLNPDVADRLGAIARGPIGARAAEIAAAADQVRVALKGNANKLLVMDVLMDALAP